MRNLLIKALAFLIRPAVKLIYSEIESEKYNKELGTILKLNNAMAEEISNKKAKIDNYIANRKIKTLNKTIVELNSWASEHRKIQQQKLAKSKIKPVKRVQ